MGVHLNPLEKEALIKRYCSNPDVNINDFCNVNNVSITSFKKWLQKYSEEGIEGLISKEKGSEVTQVLADGIEPTTENLKREIMKLRIENERLKKNYIVQKMPDGSMVYKRLKEKSSE